MVQIVVLSGPIAVGKTSFAKSLELRHPIFKVSTSKALVDAGYERNRASLQAGGEALDKKTDGQWVADAVKAQMVNAKSGSLILVDSARIAKQVEKLRAQFGAENVLHVHLTAPDDELAKRYAGRDQKDREEFQTYREAKANKTEAAVEELKAVADSIVDTSLMDPASQVTFATTGVLKGTSGSPPGRVDVFVGGQWGSEGKGNICASVAGEYPVLVRVGGPNAGHKVAFPPYKYVQLPSATGTYFAEHQRSPKVLIAAGSTIWLPTLLKEIEDHPYLKVGRNLVIDDQAMIIDPEDRRVEASLLGSISSTMQGVGAAVARKIIGRGGVLPFGPPVRLARDEPKLAGLTGDTKAEIEIALRKGLRIMLEGTQGTDLSIHHGSYPHVTSRETSCTGCLSDAGIGHNVVGKVVLVVRTYPIRVGGESGPIGIETSFSAISNSSGIPLQEIERTEIGTVSGKTRRIAEFNWEQVRKSAILNGATDIALTFADYLGIANRQASDFNGLLPDTKKFVKDLERVTGLPVSFISKEFSKTSVLNLRKQPW